MKTADPGGFSFTTVYIILPPVNNFLLYAGNSGFHMATVNFHLDKERKIGKHLRDVHYFLLNTYDELFPKGMQISQEEAKRKSIEIKEAYHVFSGRREENYSSKLSLIDFIPVFQERYQNKVSVNHIQHFSGIKMHLEKFQKKSGTAITFESINKDFYIKFTDYLKEAGLKPNTIGSHIRRIKRLMNEANEDKLTSNQAHRARSFKVVSEEADTIYLTEEEIQALYNLNIEDNRMRRIRDLFVLNCHTGLRHSDWSKVTLSNIEDGKLYVKTQKTKEAVIIPVHPIIHEIINRYGDDYYIPTNQETNRVLRWIGEYAVLKKISSGNLEKWLQIRTHTVRRSFATNAYLSGVPMLSIMQITGLKNSSTSGSVTLWRVGFCGSVGFTISR